MILITGGTGQVGSTLTQQLIKRGEKVRILVRPAKKTPNLPKSTSVEVVICSLQDERSLRAAMRGVHTVYHLAGSERAGSRVSLEEVDVQGTREVVLAAKQAGVERLIYLSHLGADRGSAYSVIKAKGIAEGIIVQSELPYTIVRSAVIYGERDQFTTSLVRMLRISPSFFLIPGDGENLLQPICVADVITCLISAQENPEAINKIYSIGGPEYFSFRQVLDILSERIGIKRNYININPAYLRTLSLLLEQSNPKFPISIHWLDYLASDRTCPVESVPRQFDLLPARFTQNLEYLDIPQKKRRKKQ